MGLFGNLGNFVTSIFTPPGTNARQSQEKKQQKVADVAGGFVPDIADILRSDVEAYKGFQPIRLDSIKNALGSLSNMGQLNLNNELRTSLLGSARDTTQEQLNQLRKSGTGNIGLERGLALRNDNEANRAANESLMHTYSPSGQLELADAIDKLLSGSFLSGDLNTLAQLASIIFEQPSIQVGSSPLESLLGEASNIIGALSAGKKK